MEPGGPQHGLDCWDSSVIASAVLWALQQLLLGPYQWQGWGVGAVASWPGLGGSLGLSTRARALSPAGLAWLPGGAERRSLVSLPGLRDTECHLFIYMFFTHEPDFTGPGDMVPPLGALSFIYLGVRSQIKHLKD